jgi:hypothetical protein
MLWLTMIRYEKNLLFLNFKVIKHKEIDNIADAVWVSYFADSNENYRPCPIAPTEI